MTASANITSVLREHRLFAPSQPFAQNANLNSEEDYDRLYRESIENPELFWAQRAEEELEWFRKWDRVLEWDLPFAKWFVGGQINATHNCLDRHVRTWRANKAALIWEGETGETRTVTY